MKAFISPSFWSDPEIEELTPGEKLSILWLITNRETTVLGVCEISERRFQFETGLDPKVLNEVLEKMEGKFTLIGRFVFIRKFIHHQFGRGEPLKKNNYFKRMVPEFKKLKPEIQIEILEEYSEFEGLVEGLARAYEGLGKGYGRGRQAPGKVGLGKERSGRSRKHGPPPEDYNEQDRREDAIAEQKRLARFDPEKEMGKVSDLLSGGEPTPRREDEPEW